MPPPLVVVSGYPASSGAPKPNRQQYAVTVRASRSFPQLDGPSDDNPAVPTAPSSEDDLDSLGEHKLTKPVTVSPSRISLKLKEKNSWLVSLLN